MANLGTCVMLLNVRRWGYPPEKHVEFRCCLAEWMGRSAGNIGSHTGDLERLQCV